MTLQKIKPTIQHARKVLEIVSHGLVIGAGIQERGKLCVEAAVCMAFGLPHGDNPPCVALSVRAFKIALNDSPWISDKARAKGLRKLSIAQLGSDTIDESVFVKELTLATIRKIVPLALRAAAAMQGCVAEHKPKLEATAKACEDSFDLGAAHAASAAASDAASDASYAARAASYAASAAARAASYAASDASYAASAASAAARAASYAARAASYAASAASDASAAASAAARAKDEVLTIMAECGVEALNKAGSPGCKWLHLCDE